MHFLFIFTAFLLAAQVSFSQQTIPADGNYAILNAVISPQGNPVALTFDGNGNAAIVTPFIPGAYNQTWTLTSATTTTKTVHSTLNGLEVQPATGGGFIIVASPRGNTWTIVTGTYTLIQGARNTSSWGVAVSTSGETVTITSGTGVDARSRWVLLPI
ncbi:hypothetical protein M422DRAFT_54109 [Sphaerobolus stellatus SS14]|uniref:Unplaced genomic scaffold SPHSTscaffold_204, whole genome shotgun sequence n=1 Tax=Sphaerobolus stellatus (strain SS14) TaxID=990650 RepID=A0A0C9UWS9_SPHS4|nr:hypothetical protein M422DRAFT_54109 [Sphaerobolus stellatus SS14]